MEGARGPVCLSFLTVLGLLCSLPCVQSTFLRFEPGYEYQYRYQSRAHVHGVDSFTMEARVGYTCVEELSEGQEIKLNVIALTLQSEKGQGVTGHRWDLSKWFSFVMTPRGEVLHVKHERERAGADEEGEGETVAIKKGLAALLAARLHHHSEQAGVRIVKTGEAWRYDVQEMGHEGAHNATYHATPTPQGITFTKVRHSHPVSHAAASYNKTLHYHEDLKMFHAVEIKEHFDVMADPPTGYDPYIKGQKRPDEDNELPELPSMTGEGHGKLQFLTKIRVTDVQSLVPPDVDMVNTSIHVYKVEEKKAGRGRVKKVGEVMDQITGKLTCMRTPPHLTESKVLQECFHSLVDILRSLANRDVTTLTLEYLGPESRVSHYQRDQEHMLDAIWAVETEHAQNEVTRTVLLSDTPAPGHVERVLYLIGGSDRLPSESIIQTLASLTLKPEEHADLYQRGELRHRLVLVLGTVISHLNHSGQTGRASALAKQLQDMLGLHDPHTFRQKRSTMTEAESIDEDQWKVVLLESLGNARLDQSYEHIVSHVNSSNSQWVKRAGVHALRHYHHDYAADVLLLAALYDEHETVRYESAREYLRHPASRVSLLTTDPRPLSNSSRFDDPFDMELKAVGSHHRRRRDLFEELELLIQSPTVEWQKIMGSSKIGASFGLTIRNALDIKIGLLSGHGKVDVFDEAFGQVNLGFMGINVDIMRLRLCFKGHASYNLNLFQEYDVGQVTRVVELFDKLKAQTVGAISDGVTLFRDILQGDPPVADVIKEFGDAIKNLPNKMLDAGKEIHKALDKISQYDDKKLPPFIIKLKNLVHKVSNLINDIRSDVTGFYNKLMTATVVIPYGAKQIFLSVENIIDSFDDLQRDPKSALSTVTGSTLTVGVQVKAMVEAVKEAKEAAFFLKKEKPYWWDLRAQTRDLLALAKEVVKDIKKQGPAWVKAELKEVKDGIEQFSSGSIDAEALKQQIVEELASLPEIVHSLSPLNNLGDELQEAFSSLFDLVTNVHKAYVQLRDGARKAKQFIERVFGPRVHKKFPRVTRTPGGGCAGKGFYPSSLQSAADPEYSDDGVDLLKPLGSDVVAPVPGIVYLSGQENQVVVESRGGSPKGALFVITNVKANDTVKLRTDSLYSELKVVAGQKIGQVTRSPCPGFNHIHLAIKKGNASIDPTRFLEPRLPEMPKWIQECDDYKYVFKGRTLAAGSLAGLAGRQPNDTSPARTPAPQKPSSLPADKNPSTKLDQDISQSSSVSKKVKDNKTKAKDTAAGSKDNALKTLLESATAFLRQFNVKDLKMGALVKFIHALDFQDSLSKLTNVFQTIQAMLNNKPCKNPNAMSDEDLRTELRKQGKSTTGSRDTLIKTMRQRSDRCPMLSLALPKQLYCTLDPLCLGIQCCLDVRVALFRKVYNMYLRLDPCSLALVVGIQDSIRKFEQTFGPDFALNDIYGGGEFVEPTGITIDALNSQLYLKGKLEKEDKEVVLSVGVSFCQMEDSSDCIMDLKILDRAVMPLPVCGPDGSIYFPKVDMKRMLKNQKDKFKANAKQSLSDAVTFVADQAFDAIPCLHSEA